MKDLCQVNNPGQSKIPSGGEDPALVIPRGDLVSWNSSAPSFQQSRLSLTPVGRGNQVFDVGCFTVDAIHPLSRVASFLEGYNVRVEFKFASAVCAFGILVIRFR